MPIIEKANLKQLFQTGMVPREEDYNRFIDASYAWREGWRFHAPHLLDTSDVFLSSPIMPSNFPSSGFHIPLPLNAHVLHKIRFRGRAQPEGGNETMVLDVYVVLSSEMFISELADLDILSSFDPLENHVLKRTVVLPAYVTDGPFDFDEVINFPLNTTLYEFVSVFMAASGGSVRLFPVGCQFH